VLTWRPPQALSLQLCTPVASEHGTRRLSPSQCQAQHPPSAGDAQRSLLSSSARPTRGEAAVYWV